MTFTVPESKTNPPLYLINRILEKIAFPTHTSPLIAFSNTPLQSTFASPARHPLCPSLLLKDLGQALSQYDPTDGKNMLCWKGFWSQYYTFDMQTELCDSIMVTVLSNDVLELGDLVI